MEWCLSTVTASQTYSHESGNFRKQAPRLACPPASPSLCVWPPCLLQVCIMRVDAFYRSAQPSALALGAAGPRRPLLRASPLRGRAQGPDRWRRPHPHHHHHAAVHGVQQVSAIEGISAGGSAHSAAHHRKFTLTLTRNPDINTGAIKFVGVDDEGSTEMDMSHLALYRGSLSKSSSDVRVVVSLLTHCLCCRGRRAVRCVVQCDKRQPHPGSCVHGDGDVPHRPGGGSFRRRECRLRSRHLPAIRHEL